MATALLLMAACTTDGRGPAQAGPTAAEEARSSIQVLVSTGGETPHLFTPPLRAPVEVTPTPITNLGRNRAGQTITDGKHTIHFDKDGFPEFSTKFQTILDNSHIGTGKRFAHYKAANQRLFQAIKEKPELANELGLSRGMTEELQTSMAPPNGYSWHHHQDVGRMQLILLGDHKLAAPHTGGMAIWGGGQ